MEHQTKSTPSRIQSGGDLPFNAQQLQLVPPRRVQSTAAVTIVIPKSKVRSSSQHKQAKPQSMETQAANGVNILEPTPTQIYPDSHGQALLQPMTSITPTGGQQVLLTSPAARVQVTRRNDSPSSSLYPLSPKSPTSLHVPRKKIPEVRPLETSSEGRAQPQNVSSPRRLGTQAPQFPIAPPKGCEVRHAQSSSVTGIQTGQAKPSPPGRTYSKENRPAHAAPQHLQVSPIPPGRDPPLMPLRRAQSLGTAGPKMPQSFSAQPRREVRRPQSGSVDRPQARLLPLKSMTVSPRPTNAKVDLPVRTKPQPPQVVTGTPQRAPQSIIPSRAPPIKRATPLSFRTPIVMPSTKIRRSPSRSVDGSQPQLAPLQPPRRTLSEHHPPSHVAAQPVQVSTLNQGNYSPATLLRLAQSIRRVDPQATLD